MLVVLPGERCSALPKKRLRVRVRIARRIRRALVASYARLIPYAAAAIPLYLLIDARDSGLALDVRNLLLIGGIVVVLAFTPRTLAVVAPVALVILMALTWTSPLVRTRTFFGVIEVRSTADQHQEYSGTTLHGTQFTDGRSREPTTYYVRIGPLGDVFNDLRTRTQGARIGVVGLGAGTIAAYAQAGDQMTFYEINPATVDIARNPAYFTYLTDAAVSPRIVEGDGRLLLEDEPAASFDLLVLDAFSSDTVPAHLLTREAIQTYVRTLRPGGVLVFHLSNRYYDLMSPVSATAESLGLATATRESKYQASVATATGAANSAWLVAGDSNAVARFRTISWQEPPHSGSALTDDYSDLTRWLNFY